MSPPVDSFASGPVVLRGKRMTYTVTRLAPGVLLSTHVGYDDGEITPAFTRLIEEEIGRASKVYTFANAMAQTGLAADARDMSAAWMKRNRDSIVRAEVLFNSRMMEMAMNLFSLLSGQRERLRYHSSIASFETAIARVVPGFTHIPRATG